MDFSQAMLTIRRSRNALKSAIGLSVLSAMLLLGSAPRTSAAESAGGSSIETDAREAFLVDFETGTVLLEKNADERMPPSSMSKLMTTVMLFDRLKEGSLSLDEEFRISANAWRKGGAASGGSTMFLRPNETVRIEDLLRGIIVQSGNDACIVVAENLQGSEENFAAAMNRRAAEIGLSNSHFMNATGLPDEAHYMTARDLAKLARYMLINFPEYHKIYGEKEFAYNGISQHNRNPLLYTMPGADGLKTGHTEIAGYGLTGTAVINDRRQILVINGLTSVRARSEEAQKLMDWGFRNFENKTLFTQGETITTAEVWLGEHNEVPLMAQEDLRYTLPRRAIQNLDIKVVYTGPIPAPINKGDAIAKLVINGTDMAKPIEVPLVAAADVERLGFVGRLLAAAKSLLIGSGGLDTLADDKS